MKQIQLKQPVVRVIGSFGLKQSGLHCIAVCLFFVFFCFPFCFCFNLRYFFLGADLGTCVQVVTPLATIPDNKYPVKISLSLKHKENVERKRKALGVTVGLSRSSNLQSGVLFFQGARENGKKKRVFFLRSPDRPLVRCHTFALPRKKKNAGSQAFSSVRRKKEDLWSREWPAGYRSSNAFLARHAISPGLERLRDKPKDRLKATSFLSLRRRYL